MSNEAQQAVQSANATAQASATPAAVQAPAQATTAQSQAKSPVSTTPPSILDDAGKTNSVADSGKTSLLDQAKAEGEQNKGDKGEVKETPVGAPEKYEIKAPEGVTIDQAAVEKFTPLAKELGLSNEAAQKLVNFQSQMVQEQVRAQEQAYNKFLEDTANETRAAYGNKLGDALVYVAKARDMFASPTLMEKLNASGLANDKDVIQLFEKLGRQISEDKHIEGQRKSSPEITAEQMFPSMKQSN